MASTEGEARWGFPGFVLALILLGVGYLAIRFAVIPLFAWLTFGDHAVSDDVAVPTAVGVVTRVEREALVRNYLLHDGSVVPISDVAHRLHGGSPRVGHLLLTGDGVDQYGLQWVIALDESDGCYWLDGPWERRDEVVAFAAGVALPLLDGYRPRGSESSLCLDATGTVVGGR